MRGESFVLLAFLSYYVAGRENEAAGADDCPGSIQSASDQDFNACRADPLVEPRLRETR